MPSGLRRMISCACRCAVGTRLPYCDLRAWLLQAHIAASKTLPLGTIAWVVNVQTDKAAVVKVEDRGPFVAEGTCDDESRRCPD